jgi:hypothetical protein
MVLMDRAVTRTILYIAVSTSCNCIQCHVLCAMLRTQLILNDVLFI